MVYICLTYAGPFYEPLQPYAAINIPNLYDSSHCIVPGTKPKQCPPNTTTKTGSCWTQTCLHQTSFCAEKEQAVWYDDERHPGQKRHRWDTVKAPHTCCKYPTTNEMYDVRYAEVSLYDEDYSNTNDLIGTVPAVDLHKSEQVTFYPIEELDETGAKTGHNISLGVYVSWHRPQNYTISTAFNYDPLHWTSTGLSITGADAPWEIHGEDLEETITEMLDELVLGDEEEAKLLSEVSKDEPAAELRAEALPSDRLGPAAAASSPTLIAAAAAMALAVVAVVRRKLHGGEPPSAVVQL